MTERTGRSAESLLAHALESRRELEGLKTNKAFLILSSIVQEQVDDLQRSILFNPCSGVDSAWIQEYKKGQLEGRLSWQGTLDTSLDSLEVTITNLRSQFDEPSDESGREGITDSAP